MGTKRQLILVTLLAAFVGAAVGVGVTLTTREERRLASLPRQPRPQELELDVSTEGWATLGETTSEHDELLEVPLLWTDQARVCWDITGDLEELSITLFGEEVGETFRTTRIGSDCKYFVPKISHAASSDCATVAASAIGDVEWALVVQQEESENYGLSGINSTRQLSLLSNPCTGEAYDVPPHLVACDDGTYAKSSSDCTWAERQFAPYHPKTHPDWTCDPATGQCMHPEGGVVPERPQSTGSYCDRSACYLDY